MPSRVFNQWHYHLILVEPHLLYFLAGLWTDWQTGRVKCPGWPCAQGAECPVNITGTCDQEAQRTAFSLGRDRLQTAIVPYKQLYCHHPDGHQRKPFDLRILVSGSAETHHKYNYCCKRNLEVYAEFSLISKLSCSVFLKDTNLQHSAGLSM